MNKRPDYERKIDKDLFKYVDYETAIIHQQQLIRDKRTDGRKITANYELKEGSFGGLATYPEENIVLGIMEAEESIRYYTEYREHIEKIIHDTFPEEEQKFIRLYWFEAPPVMRSIRIRKEIVLGEMRFLRSHNDQSFYNWRDRIYAKFAEVLGYGE